MTADAGGWLLAALLGGVLALDGTSIGQFMLSRPLVACTLAGALAGSPLLGAGLGVVLEALHLAVLPVGAARYPEAAPAAVAAATVFVGAGGGYDALLVLTLFAVAWEQLGSWSITRLRSWTGEHLPEPTTVRAVERRHLRAIALDGARGLAVTALGLAVAAGLMPLLAAVRADPEAARLGTGLAAATALGASLRLFGGRRLPWFAAGAVLALASLWGGG